MSNTKLDIACDVLKQAIANEVLAEAMEERWVEMSKHSTVKELLKQGVLKEKYVRVISVANMDCYGRLK